jgi:hypothetical protein
MLDAAVKQDIAHLRTLHVIDEVNMLYNSGR